MIINLEVNTELKGLDMLSDLNNNLDLLAFVNCLFNEQAIYSNIEEYIIDCFMIEDSVSIYNSLNELVSNFKFRQIDNSLSDLEVMQILIEDIEPVYFLNNKYFVINDI